MDPKRVSSFMRMVDRTAASHILRSTHSHAAASPTGKPSRQLSECLHCRFAVAEGDLLTSLNVWEAWQAAGTKARHWAGSHRVNHRALLRAADIHAQLCHHLRCWAGEA